VALGKADEKREVEAFGRALLALAQRPDALSQRLPVAAEAMKHHGAPRAELVQLVRAIDPSAPPPERGYTAFLVWLKDAPKVDRAIAR